MAQPNADLAQRMLRAFNAGNVDAVLATFTDDCVLREPPEMPDSPAEGFRGHEGVRTWMANLRDVAGIQFELIGFSPGGDALLCELASRGRGEAGGVPFRWTTFAVLRVRERRIARVEAFLSREEAVAAAGKPV